MSVKIQLSSLTPEQKIFISKELTIKPKNNRYSKMKPFKCFIIRDGFVYVPFNFYLENFGIPNESLQAKIIDCKFTEKLRDYQEPICAQAIEMLQNNGSVILHLRTSFGKTVVVVYLICQSCHLSVILYDRKIFKVQWIDTISKFSNLKYHIIGETKNETPIEQADVIICSNRRIDKIPNEIKDQIGVLVVDECHKFCTENNMKVMLRFTPKFCIFLTATFKKDNKLEKIVELINGTESKITVKNDVTFKLLCVPCNVNFLKDYKIVEKKDLMDIWNHLLDKQSRSVFRYQLIVRLVKYLSDKKICILTSRKITASILLELLTINNETTETMIGSKDNYNDSHVLIGTISKIGTGFDEKSCCANFNGIRINCLIIVSTNQSELIFEQVVGRGLRSTDLEVYSIIDQDSVSQKHYKLFANWALNNCGTVNTFDSEILNSIQILGLDSLPMINISEDDLYEID